CIASLRMYKCGSNRLRAVGNAQKIASLLLTYSLRTGSDILQNTLTILLTWVFVSNNEEVGHFSGYTSHDRPFLCIAFPRRAKNDDQFALCQGAQDCQHLL